MKSMSMCTCCLLETVVPCISVSCERDCSICIIDVTKVNAVDLNANVARSVPRHPVNYRRLTFAEANIPGEHNK